MTQPQGGEVRVFDEEDCAPDCEERARCDRTDLGHNMCGYCDEHDLPIHHCPCAASRVRQVGQQQ